MSAPPFSQSYGGFRATRKQAGYATGEVGAGDANAPLLFTTIKTQSASLTGSSLAHVKRIAQSNGGFKMLLLPLHHGMTSTTQCLVL